MKNFLTILFLAMIFHGAKAQDTIHWGDTNYYWADYINPETQSEPLTCTFTQYYDFVADPKGNTFYGIGLPA